MSPPQILPSGATQVCHRERRVSEGASIEWDPNSNIAIREEFQADVIVHEEAARQRTPHIGKRTQGNHVAVSA